MQEYSLKFLHFSMYSPTMEDNPRPRMNYFVMGVSRFVVTDFCTTILLNDMDISTLMVYARTIEDSKTREFRQEGKSPRSDNSIHQKHNNRFFHKDSMVNKDSSPKKKFPRWWPHF